MNIEVDTNLTNWDKALIDEIDDILDGNYERYENGIDLSDGIKLDIAREVSAEFDWEDLRYFIMEKINRELKNKLDYLRKKEKVTNLDDEERFDLETLEMWEGGNL